MNKREANVIIEEADSIDEAGEELLGFDTSDACSYTKDLAVSYTLVNQILLYV